MAPRLVVRADQPGGAGRCAAQLDVVGSFGEGGNGDAQRLVGRADIEVVADADPGQLDHLVVLASPGGVAGEVGEVGAHRLAQQIEGLLVQSASLTPEQLVLDCIADELVAEAELVVGLFDEEATIDKGAQIGDQLLFGAVAEDGQHVELRPWSEHRRRLDELALFDRQAVELPADQFGERPWQRLGGERLGIGVAGRGEDLLEEERVAAGPIAQRVDDSSAELPAVHGGHEGADLVMVEAFEVHLVNVPPSFEADHHLPTGQPGRELVRAIRGDQRQPGQGHRRQLLEHSDAVRIRPVQVLDDHESEPITDSCGHRVHRHGAGVDQVGRGVVEHRPDEVERPAQGPRFGVGDEYW